MKKISLLIGLAAALAAAYLAYERFAGLQPKAPGSEPPVAEAEPAFLYQCPMHPQIVRKEPGLCPICHMALEKIVNSAAKKVQGAVEEGPAVPEHASFDLEPEREKLMGMRTVKAGIQDLVRGVPAPGEVLEGGRKVSVEVFEFEAGLIRPGQSAEIQSPDSPGKRQSARVASVGRNPDPATRTLAVVLAVAPGAGLKAGILVEARIRVPLGRALALPKDAVFDTGEHRLAFVRTGGGHFEVRDIRLGREGDGWLEVQDGVKEGEEVVVSANFLVDSESRFRAAAQEYGSHAH